MIKLDIEQSSMAISKQQDEKGLFPTYRAKKGERIIESESAKIRNIGIHTFVLEKLMELYPIDPRTQTTYRRGLDCLVRDAISYKGVPVWRWLKNPSSKDYVYPPDYDDTARARVVIEEAKDSGLVLSEGFSEFPFEELLEEGLSQQGGVYIFMGEEKRTSERVDPMVNANVLYALMIHLRKRDIPITGNKLVETIAHYLEGVIRSGEYFGKFEDISRCYLSHNLFGYVISETQKKQPIFDSKTLKRVKERIEIQEAKYLNSLEASLASLALINLESTRDLIKKGRAQIQQSVGDSHLWAPEPLFQHQRLGHVFGSRVGTSIFCVEALIKSKQIR